MIIQKTDGNKILRVFEEEQPENPREWDNFGHMICFHNRYKLGDKHDYAFGSFDSFEDLKMFVKKGLKGVVILPLYLYDHSGITISTTPFNRCWDSGQIGFIYVTKADLKREEIKKKDAEEYLKGEINTYDQYLRGDVYRYEIVEKVKCSHCHHEEETTVEACGGFYGDDFNLNGLNCSIKESGWKGELL